MGPDPNRFYARDLKRWTITSGDVEKDAFKVRIVVNSRWGYRETFGAVIIPIVAFVIFGSMCLAIRNFDPQNDFVEQFFWSIVGICIMQVIFFGMLIWFEVSYFSRFHPEVLTVFHNREFSTNGDKGRYALPNGSVLRYTIYPAESDCQGASEYSELDLVVRDGDKEIAVHKLMAYQHNWCWKPAKQLSKLSGLPLKKVVQWR